MRLRLPRGTFMTDDGQIFEARRVYRLGRSWVVAVPKAWVELLAPQLWVQVDVSDQELIVKPLDEAQLEAVKRWESKSSGKRSN